MRTQKSIIDHARQSSLLLSLSLPSPLSRDTAVALMGNACLYNLPQPPVLKYRSSAGMGVLVW
jgi:hypothetical protein